MGTSAPPGLRAYIAPAAVTAPNAPELSTPAAPPARSPPLPLPMLFAEALIFAMRASKWDLEASILIRIVAG